MPQRHISLSCTDVRLPEPQKLFIIIIVTITIIIMRRRMRR
jgi:hypothetical protein